jgi:UDP-N-acetylmuramoylalanine--D-glutamate ligase
MFLNYLDFKNKLKGKTVAILGIGVSNTPLLKMLLDFDCHITIRDKQEELPIEALDIIENKNVKIILGKNYLDNINEDYLFRSPGIMSTNEKIVMAVSNGSVLTSEMEVFFDICPALIIGITGSDGKTTTTTLIYEILKLSGYTCHLGGNIGKPLLADIKSIKKDDIVIVELSSFQLMSMTKSPNIAVITNLAPNHLDKHKDMEEYIEAKTNIFKHNCDKVILNNENGITKSFITCKSTTFSLKEPQENGAYLKDDKIYFKDKYVMDRADIILPGIHNVDNYLAAICAVSDLCDFKYVKEIAKSFGGVEHRIEFVKEVDGVKYYNDSIASSPSRAIAGLFSFDQKVIIISGGSDKGIGFDDFAKAVVDRVKNIILMGETKGKIKEAILKIDKDFPIQEAISLEDAVLKARAISRSGDIVILCPACASFDFFKNFMDRGNQFKELVKSL